MNSQASWTARAEARERVKKAGITEGVPDSVVTRGVSLDRRSKSVTRMVSSGSLATADVVSFLGELLKGESLMRPTPRCGARD